MKMMQAEVSSKMPHNDRKLGDCLYSFRNIRVEKKIGTHIRSLQLSSVAQSCPTLCKPMDRSTPGLPVHHQPQSLLKPMSIESVMPSNHLILCCPLRLPPSIFPSIRVFTNQSAPHISWLKYWSFSFNISPSNEHPGLISFRMDRLDLLAVPGTLKSLLQHHSSKALILQCSAFFMVQLSHPRMTTGKTIALTMDSFPEGLSTRYFIPSKYSA